jgi:hypothetical protein
MLEHINIALHHGLMDVNEKLEVVMMVYWMDHMEIKHVD